MKAAVFLDRDGTLNEEVGYINHIDRFLIFPWTGAAVRKLNLAGIPAVVVTNQSGVARGYFPETLIQETHEKLSAELARQGAALDGIYYCPHLPDAKVESYRLACVCRKPAPGMLHRAAGDLGLDLKQSFVVSDRYQDLSMGFRVGAQGVLLLTGYGKGEYLYQKDMWRRQPDFVAADLLQGVEWIVQQVQSSA